MVSSFPKENSITFYYFSYISVSLGKVECKDEKKRNAIPNNTNKGGRGKFNVLLNFVIGSSVEEKSHSLSLSQSIH